MTTRVELGTPLAEWPQDAHFYDIWSGDRLIAHAARERRDSPAFYPWTITFYDRDKQKLRSHGTHNPAAAAKQFVRIQARLDATYGSRP